MEYKSPPTLIEQYTESYRPTEVVQPLGPAPDAKPPKKKAPPGIPGTPLPTGLLSPTGQEPTPPPALGPEKERQKIVLNFDKADIGEVTSQIFGDHLKVSYVVDQALQGRMSMYLEGEFTNQELLQMITRAYEANGVSVVPRKGFYYIQASQKAGSGGLPIADKALLAPGKEGTRPLVVVYRLRYMDAKQASNLASPFLSPGKKVIVEPLTNSLIFIEEADNARAIVSLLQTIDINILQEVSMEIVPLRSIAPQDAVQGMENLLNKLGGVKDSAIKSSLAFIPLQSFGGVLVMAQTNELLKSAKQWLQAIDVQGVESGEQIYVYFVQNGLSRDIADILNQVYGLGGGGGRRLDQQVVPSGRAGSRGGFGSSGGFGGSSGSSGSSFGSSSSGSGFGSRSGSSGSSMSGSGSSGGSSAGSTSRGASGTGLGAGGAGGTGLGAGGKGPERPKIFTGEVTLIADEVNNAIVTRANAVDYAKIKKTIETLDILPRAVLIDVMIAEITLNKDFQYGIQHFFESGQYALSLAGLGSTPTTATGTTVSPVTINLSAFPNIGSVAGAGGFALARIGGQGDLNTFMRFLSSKTNVNILSNPTLLATDNKDATLTVGGRQPVPTGSFSGGTTTDLTTASVFSTIQYEETGTILNITPHINAGGLVRLEMEGVIRRVGANATVGVNNTAPTFVERNIKTTLLAQSGSTIVIGGIIDSTQSNDKSGIPFLQDVPMLAPIFGSASKSLNRTELIIAITPHVIDQRGSEAPREFLEKLKVLKSRIQQ
ncbi:MAG: type II secretion system secretin GspD [Syntrophobacteraceae bacterium]